MFDDFKELLSIFNDQKVKYLIVGGYAVSLHAQPRATKDIDLLIQPAPANGKAVYAALKKFGAPLAGLTAADFIERDKFFRMGRAPVMVDILPEISGVDFDRAWQRRVEAVVALYLNRRLWPFTALNSVLTQLWCNIMGH